MFIRQIVCLAIVLTLSITCHVFAESSKDTAFAKLNGVWVAEKVLHAGTQIPADKFPFELHFVDQKLIFKFVGSVQGKDRVHDLAIQATAEPFTMDMTRTVVDKKVVVHAIFRFDGDRLLICSLRDAKGQPSKERPTLFESNETVRSDLLILKRKPPAEK
jgi:uncharacterized protein (TIGR03067 family)